VAILIVISIVLLFLLLKEPLKAFTQVQTQEPNQGIEQCINKVVEGTSDLLIEYGGYTKLPALSKAFGYHLGEADEIPYKNYTYLCYTGKLRAKCIPQEASMIENLRKEISDYIKPKIEDCFSNGKRDLENNGYTVNLANEMNFSVELIPRAVIVDVKREMEIKKADEEKKFSEFTSRITSPIYNFGILSQEIVRQESLYCNSEYIELMKTNQRFEIAKYQTGDDNKLYSIKDESSEKIFRFLIRGCVLPTPA